MRAAPFALFEIASPEPVNSRSFTSLPAPFGSAKAVAAQVQFDVGYHQMLVTSKTEIPQFWIMVHERSITTTTVAVADHMMNNFPNRKLHEARASYDLPTIASPKLLFVSGRLLI